jgi:hypothetical protein
MFFALLIVFHRRNVNTGLGASNDLILIIVHRLTAALALFIRLSPWYNDQVKTLLEVLQVKGTLQSKLTKGDGWESEGGVSKKDVRQLIAEVADKLCS